MSDIEYEKYRLMERAVNALEVLAGIRNPSPTKEPQSVGVGPKVENPDDNYVHYPGEGYLLHPDPEPEAKLTKGEYVNIDGTLLEDPVSRDVNTRYGPKEVINFKLSTPYGPVRVSLWDLPEAMDYTANDQISLTNMQVKEPYDGIQQVSSCRNTRIE